MKGVEMWPSTLLLFCCCRILGLCLDVDAQDYGEHSDTIATIAAWSTQSCPSSTAGGKQRLYQ